MKRSCSHWTKIPLTEEEWKRVRLYQRLPLRKKLALLDRMRSLMFDLWKENPSMRRGKIQALRKAAAKAQVKGS